MGPLQAAAPGPLQVAAPKGQQVEHEYEREGALCYLAAWDARRAKIFDRCAAKDGIEPFDQLVDQFMSQHPYRRAQRVFLVIDNGSAHRGKRSIDRLQGTWPNMTVVHTPIHASWVNQAEIYFSVVQRKVITPNDFADLDTLQQQLLAFGRRYEQIAAPFQWKFTREDLHEPSPRPTPDPPPSPPEPSDPYTCANFRARPLSTSPQVVADATVAALDGRTRTVWVPAALRYVFAVLRHLPGPVYRRLPL